jgi:hypothetical protein
MARLADDAIFQFPVLVSETVSMDELNMVCNALEYLYANFTLTALSLDASIDDTEEDTNVRERLRRYHQNNTVDYAKVRINDNNRDEYFNTESSNVLKYSNDFEYKPLSEARGDGRPSNPRFNPTTAGERNTVHNVLVTGNKTYEFKKERNIEPLKLNMNFNVRGVEQSVVLGIKAVPHRLPSNEIMYFAGTSTTESRNLFRFIQWTTGEISFAKDFVLNIDGILKRAEITKKKSFWWDALRYRAILSKWKQTLYAKDQVLPNSTVVLTMEEVEMINNDHNVNLFKDISAAKNFMNKFFLLGLVILDPANEHAYIFYDSQKDYQYYTYNSLKKEPETQDKTLKAMMALAQR